jgi:hypothetical protein
MKYTALLCLFVAACVAETDPEWQLNHDRLVAVRAAKPHIAPGEATTFDALVAHKGAPTDIEQALGVIVYGPQDLSDVASGVTVTAPSAARLDAERATLGLDPGTPVPLDVLMEFPDSNGIHLAAKKTIYLGDSAANATTVGNVLVNGAPPDPAIVIPIDIDVPLSVDAADDATVAWLTGCGTMHDDDEHSAFIHVQKGDPKDGELVVVVRDALGGVVWQVWPISAQ